MTHGAFHRAAIVGAALALSFAFAACQSSAGPTPQQPGPPGPPQPTPQQPGPPQPQPTPQQPGPPGPPQPTPQQPGPPGPPGNQPTPNQPPTPGPTPKTPTATPAPATSVCTHTSSSPTWFEDQASHVSWTVYCAVLASGWSVDSASATYNNGGQLSVTYHSGGAIFQLQEGQICGSAGTGCATSGSDVGSVQFGDLNGEMYALSSTSYGVWVKPGGATIYFVNTNGLTATQVSDLVFAMHKVPKP